MRLLLDTHVWIWSLLEPDRIRPSTRRELQRKENELWLSPVSIWEALVLHRKGRLALEPDPFVWVEVALKEVPMHEAALNFTVAALSEKLSMKGKDPADRFLAATACAFGLVLVTADADFRTTRDYGVLRA